MTHRRKELGKKGEDIALVYLQGNGYKIIECNFRTRLGEVDIIAEKDDVIYFVEVKTRREQDFLEGYSHQQRDRLLKIASEYIATGNLANRQVSFLLIGITGNPGDGDFKVEAVEDYYVD